MEQGTPVAVSFGDKEAGNNPVRHQVSNEIATHACDHAIESYRSRGFTGTSIHFGELAERVVGESDGPRTHHAGTHGWLGRLQRVVPITITVIDESGSGNE